MNIIRRACLSSSELKFYIFYIIKMTLLKLQKLAKLNEDLKEFNPDYQYTKHLSENNIRRASKRGQEINQEKEFNIIRAEHELNSRKKARLVNSRWLSDWTLECEFISSEWETFFKIYNEDDIFARRQEEREEKIKQKVKNENETWLRFGDYLPKWVNQKKKSFFESLRAA